MSEIIIDFDPQKSSIFLKGAIERLLENRFARRYLKDFYEFELLYNEIVLKVAKDEVEQELNKVRSMLQKYGFIEKRSTAVDSILANYLEEDYKFSEFSQKALNIRNNNFNASDFKYFSDSLKIYLPGRRLYELQLLSAYHLAFSQNACNFSVPGSGKTSIVYGAYSYLKNLPSDDYKKIDKLLVIGPLSSFGPWEDEFFECFGKAPNSTRLLGNINSADKNKYLKSNQTTEITLISYQSVRGLVGSLQIFLKRNKVMIVLDEAHKIKNTSGGITARSVLELAKNAKSRVILTGTPAPNGYEDLFNLYKFIWPTKDIIKFPVHQLKLMSSESDSQRVSNLINNISPFFIRIKKSDLNIPKPILNSPIYQPMGYYQKKVYEFIEKEYVESLMETGSNLSREFKSNLARARVIRLQQAATNPKMLLKPLIEFVEDENLSLIDIADIKEQPVIKDIIEFEKLETPSKYKKVVEIINQILAKGEKVVIWATFIYTILDLQKFLKKKGINSEVLYGAIPVGPSSYDEDLTSEITREKIIKDFHDPMSEFKVIIANPFAVGESISLHKCCHNAIYIERTFNAGHYMQSKDRIHRYGLTSTDIINYYFVLSENTIDETIHKRLNFKEKRMLEIMESMPIPLFDNALNEMGDEDIKEIISDYVKRNN